jgi:hypothetical protein
MRHCRLYEEQEEDIILDEEGGEKNRKKLKKLVYRYDWLLDEARIGDDDDVQTLQDKIIHFVIYKKKMCLGANGIDNYISPLFQFKF